MPVLGYVNLQNLKELKSAINQPLIDKEIAGFFKSTWFENLTSLCKLSEFMPLKNEVMTNFRKPSLLTEHLLSGRSEDQIDQT